MDDNFINWCKGFCLQIYIGSHLKNLKFFYHTIVDCGVVFPYVQIFYEINFCTINALITDTQIVET